MDNKKIRISGINLVRLVCCLGVIAYHFSIHAINGNSIFLRNANSAWGGIMVNVFFLLSGGLLYINHSKIEHLFLYLKKRFLSIFPAFYIAFGFTFLSCVFLNGSLFWRGKPYLIFLSLIGMDGYLMPYFTNDYYLLGEWFLGALIILYLLYPLVVKFVNKFNLYFLGIYTVIYLLFLKFHPATKLDVSQSIISCLMIFIIGIYIMKYKEQILNIKLCLPSIVLFVVTVFIQLPLPNDIIMKVCAISLFILLQQLGTLLDRTKVQLTIKYLSSLTYEVFLVQHLLITKMIALKDFGSLAGSYFELLVTTILIFIYAKGLQILANHFKDFITDTCSLIYKKFKPVK